MFSVYQVYFTQTDELAYHDDDDNDDEDDDDDDDDDLSSVG